MRSKVAVFIVIGIVAGLSGLGCACGKFINYKASIAGTVYMDGRPVTGTVLLKDITGTVLAQDRTTLAGHYMLKDISPGDYTLHYLNMQGIPVGGETAVKIRPGRLEQVDLNLKIADSQAAPKSSISGTVYLDGRPVAGTVLLKDSSGTVVAQDRTTLTGHYILKDLSAGDYVLQFLNMQGVPFGSEIVVKVRPGRFEVVDLHLKSSDRQPPDSSDQTPTSDEH